MGESIRVLVVDDDGMVAAAVESYLSSSGAFVVVHHAEEPRDALLRAASGGIDLALVDIRLRTVDGYAVVAAIAERAPRIRCVLMSSLPPADVVERAAAVGAYGVVGKACGGEALVAACRAAMEGVFVIDPAVLTAGWRRDLPERDARPVGPPEDVRLSPRELDVLRHLQAARSNRMIAREMQIAENTVKAHVQSVLRKTCVSSRSEAALLAVVDGVVLAAPRHGSRSGR